MDKWKRALTGATEMIAPISLFYASMELLLKILVIIWIIAGILVLTNHSANKRRRLKYDSEAPLFATEISVILIIVFLLLGAAGYSMQATTNWNMSHAQQVTGTVQSIQGLGGLSQTAQGFGGSSSSAYIVLEINNTNYYYFVANRGSLGDVMQPYLLNQTVTVVYYPASMNDANQRGVPNIQELIYNNQTYTVSNLWN